MGIHKAGCHHQNAEAERHGYQLTHRLPGMLLIPRAQSLAGHHRAAGCQCRKQVQHHIIDHIHQRYAGDCRLAYGGNHHAVAHAHKNGKGLLNDQRNDQPYQLPGGKKFLLSQLCLFHSLRPSFFPKSGFSVLLLLCKFAHRAFRIACLV